MVKKQIGWVPTQPISIEGVFMKKTTHILFTIGIFSHLDHTLLNICFY